MSSVRNNFKVISFFIFPPRSHLQGALIGFAPGTYLRARPGFLRTPSPAKSVASLFQD